MAELPRADEALHEIEEYISDDYVERLETSANATASGIAAVATYLEGGGKYNIRDAYRTGSLIGLNTRIVDDILDGEIIEETSEREEFLNNYIKSIQGEEVEAVENESEKSAYHAGKILGENFDRSVMSAYWKDIRDIVIHEEKSTREGYSNYSRGICANRRNDRNGSRRTGRLSDKHRKPGICI